MLDESLILALSMSALALCLTGLQDSSIRGAISPDGVHVFSVHDFITKVCQFRDGTTNGSARREFKRLTDDGSDHQAEIMGLSRFYKFPGAGQRSTPVMTIRGLQRLLAILGCKVATDYRAIVEATFTRVLAGDMSLIRMVEAPADGRVSNSVHSTARLDYDVEAPVPTHASMPASVPVAMPAAMPASVPATQAPMPVVNAASNSVSMMLAELGSDEVQRKRKICEAREECEFRLGLEERWSRLRDQALSRTERMMEMLKRLRPGRGIDDRTLLQIEEQAKSIVMGGCAVPAIPVDLHQSIDAADPVVIASDVPAPASTNAMREPTAEAPNGCIKVSSIAEEMDVKCSFGQLKEIGKRMAARYRATYQRDPPKHRQQVGGNVVAVNTYTEADRGMMEAVIREYVGC